MFDVTYQELAREWLVRCFGSDNLANTSERGHRFLEECLELVQASGVSREEVQILTDYVFSRPAGEPAQEVGGTMLTLACLCASLNVSLSRAARDELLRVSEPSMMKRIQAKNAAKPRGSPLPGQIDRVSGEGAAQ